MKILIPTLALLLSAQDEKLELRWKYQKGQELRYKTTQKTATEAAGSSIKQEMSTTFAMKVDEVDEKGLATLTCKYDAVAIKMSGFQELDYDSEKDKEAPDEPMALMMSKLVGQSFVMKMTPSGRVTDVKGFDKILEAMMKAAGEDADQEMARQMMKQMFSDDAFKSMMQQMSPPLPEEKVGKGDTWSNEFTLKMPILGSMKFGIKSKLNDIKEKNAVIDQDVKIELKADEKDENPLAGLIELKDAKGKSSCVFSLERGLFLSQKATMEMTIAAGGQEMPVKTESELRLIEKKKF